MPTSIPHTSLSGEAAYLWGAIREGRDAIIQGDRRTARLAAEELAGIAMHSRHAGIRRMAADATARLVRTMEPAFPAA